MAGVTPYTETSDALYSGQTVELEKHILIVDDDPGIRSLIGEYLGQHGFVIHLAENANAMRSVLEDMPIDLIVLDVMMPGEDGLTALRALDRKQSVAVILLSVMGSDVDRIVGLELGADDYLAKPCNPRELLARIRAVLRRRGDGRPTDQLDGEAAVYQFDGWTLNATAWTLQAPDGEQISLTSGEFKMMISFVERPRRALSRDNLLSHARGEDAEFFDRTIDVQISRLRRKLEAKGAQDMIRTIRNEGYMFTPAVQRL